MSQLIRLVQEGFVRTVGYQLVQWTAAYPLAVTTDSLEALFVIRRTVSGEVLERVATLPDFVSYPLNELKYFECKELGGNALFSAQIGDLIRFVPTIDHWLQVGNPYTDCDFDVASIESVNGAAPQIKIGNYLQLDDYTFTQEDEGRWFSVLGFTTPSHNNPVRVETVLTPHTAKVAYASGFVVVANETGTTWTKRRLCIDTAPSPTLEPRYFPTLVAGKPWELRRSGSAYGSGLVGETSRLNPSLVTFRDRRFTSILPTLAAAMNLVEVTKAGVALLQAAADQNDTSFLGVHQTDFPL